MMTLVVHGFPNNISTLRFEWAWQNPNKTTRLQHLNLKKIPRKESEFKFKLRVLSEMLKVGPWYRLPLVVRWLENDYFEAFPPERMPPSHMVICHGPVKSLNTKKSKEILSQSPVNCQLCFKTIIESEKLTCINDNCDLKAHITCLADLFLTPEEFVPIEGTCPLCNVRLKWGDLIHKMNKYEVKAVEAVAECCDKAFVDNDSWFLDCNEL
ncbi:structure-specific endonuclease subunit SLX1 homolog isoform X2 [Aricia agestis]|uniref:structure-specific endonuclease subunit SLX1 homolog isoform X2 n=1 Tax=Aricia agestis TaxID=91739 RepID=UPI001C2062ED|nr:structure-specific endonuclease subunit SLX1 homolog isoform X2 [Aricia agestis]